MATRDPISYATIDPETKRPIRTKEEVERLRKRKPVEKRGMLIVTTFCNQDIPLLKKRIEWMAFLGVKPDYDLLLIGDHDVSTEDVESMVSLHKPFFKDVLTKRIKQAPLLAGWPNGTNNAFRKTYRILSGQYDMPPFSWEPYKGWFYFEADVTILKADSFKALEKIYLDGNKNFCGFLNETRLSNGKLVRHLNGAAIYPTKNSNTINKALYNEKMMLTNNIPWDVAGMSENLLSDATALSSEKYLHAFGTWNYRKHENELICTQKLMNGTIQEKRYVLNGQLIHHGCKDGTLIDILMTPKLEENKVIAISNQIPPPKVTLIESAKVSSIPVNPKKRIPRAVKRIDPEIVTKIKEDYKNGVKWKALIGKYRIGTTAMKGIIDECKN